MAGPSLAARDIEPNKFSLLFLFLPASGLGKQKSSDRNFYDGEGRGGTLPLFPEAAAYLIDISLSPPYFSLLSFLLNSSISV